MYIIVSNNKSYYTCYTRKREANLGLAGKALNITHAQSNKGSWWAAKDKFI